MRKTNWIQICLASTIAFALAASVRSHHPEVTENNPTENAPPLIQKSTPQENPSKSTQTTQTSTFPAPLAESPVSHLPLSATLRAEVAKDPHSTPASLLRFGVDLGEQMQLARQSKTEAVRLMKELKTCALPEDLLNSPIQVRALCLVSVRKLEPIWTELREEGESIVEAADQEAIALAKNIPGFELNPHP